MLATVPISERINPTAPPTYLCMAVERLRAAFGENLVSVALYGSRARGEARPDSDVDLLVIVSGLPDHWRERTNVLQEPLRRISDEFDFSAYGKTPDEFETSFPSIYRDMGLDGIVLYDPNNYLTQKLARIRAIIDETGLRRRLLSPAISFGTGTTLPRTVGNWIGRAIVNSHEAVENAGKSIETVTD